MNTIRNIDTLDILNSESLEEVVQEYMIILDSLWYKFSKNINITKHFQVWWNKEYNTKLNVYHSSKLIVDWKDFKDFVKKTKRIFFDNKIQEITSKNKRP